MTIKPSNSTKPVAGKPMSAAQVSAAFDSAAPPTHFAQAREEYYASVGKPAVDRGRLFVITVLALVAVVGAVATLFAVLPLKTVEPYVVVVDGASGYVGRALGETQKAVDYTPERPVIERELFEFVRRLYMVNADYPKVAREAHYAAYAYTRGRAS